MSVHGHTALSLITQIIVQLAIAIDFTAVLPCLFDQNGLARLFLGRPTDWFLQSGVKPVGADVQAMAQRPHPELRAMHGDKRVLHFASLAKYAMAF